MIERQYTTKPKTGTILSIQYMRASAAIAVVIWHTGWSRTVLGQSGVDLFFIVSGFVMMLVSERENSPARFGAARFVRIAPLYWIVTVLSALFEQSPISKVITSILFWPDGPSPIVIQGWSLNLEAFYYMLFASTLTFSAYWRLWLLSSEIIIVCIVLPLIVPSNEVLNVWSSPLAFEFVAGAFLHVVWQRGYLPTGAAAWVLGTAGITILALTHALGGAPESWMRVACWGLPALAIVGAGLGIEQSGQLPRIRLIAELGKASYSIYLTHVIVIHTLTGKVISFWAPIAVAIVVIATSAFGCAVYYLVEMPIHRWIHLIFKRVRQPA